MSGRRADRRGREEKFLIDFGPSPPSSPPISRDPFDSPPPTTPSAAPASPSFATAPLSYGTGVGSVFPSSEGTSSMAFNPAVVYGSAQIGGSPAMASSLHPPTASPTPSFSPSSPYPYPGGPYIPPQQQYAAPSVLRPGQLPQGAHPPSVQSLSPLFQQMNMNSPTIAGPDGRPPPVSAPWPGGAAHIPLSGPASGSGWAAGAVRPAAHASLERPADESEKASSVRQMAARLESSARRPSTASTQAPGQSKTVPRASPRSAKDEALLPMAVGQAFAWKRWEGTTALGLHLGSVFVMFGITPCRA